LDKRYADIMKFMENVMVQWSPDLVIVEDIQLQQGAIGGYNAFKVLAGLLGVVKAVLAKHKVPHKEVLNKVWQAKFMIAGKDRNTQKKNVVAKVQQLFGIKVTDDVADAILIGKWAADQRSNVSVNKLF
jgi:Holliday junction resolvasome RuvABC endonuclease subunit